MAEVFGELFTTQEEGTKSKVIEEEVTSYREVNCIPLDADPLTWWKTKELIYPHVAMLARRYLAVSGTSVPSERVFSTAAGIVTARRSVLTSNNVDRLIFLKKNLKIWSFVKNKKIKNSSNQSQVVLFCLRHCYVLNFDICCWTMHSCWSSVLNDYFISCYKVGTAVFCCPFVSICSWEFKLPMFTIIINGKSKYKLHIFQAFILLMYRNRTEPWHHCTVSNREFCEPFHPLFLHRYLFFPGQWGQCKVQ